MPLPLRLEKSGRIFKLLAARCGDFGTLGRAMAWMVFNFSRLELERGVSLALRQAVLGKSVIGCAVHRSGPQRIRYLFPLPLGVVSNVHEAAQSMIFAMRILRCRVLWTSGWRWESWASMDWLDMAMWRL